MDYQRGKRKSESGNIHYIIQNNTTKYQIGKCQKDHPKQLQTHNLPIDDVENINSTKGK